MYMADATRMNEQCNRRATSMATTAKALITVFYFFFFLSRALAHAQVYSFSFSHVRIHTLSLHLSTRDTPWCLLALTPVSFSRLASLSWWVYLGPPIVPSLSPTSIHACIQTYIQPCKHTHIHTNKHACMHTIIHVAYVHIPTYLPAIPTS